MTIPGAVAFVLLFIFLPETKYHRTKDALGMSNQVATMTVVLTLVQRAEIPT